MTDYLRINGITIHCTGSESEPIRLGEVSRALNGAPRSWVRTEKTDTRSTTDEMYLEEARRVRALVQGEGHVWSFEDPYVASSRGLLPSSMSGEVLTEDNSGRYGYGLTMEFEAVVQWPTQLTTGWTAMVWRSLNGGPWVHQLVRRPVGAGANQVFEDGVRNDGADVGILENVSSYLQLSATEDATIFDDLVLLPYAVPDEWAVLLHAFHSARAFPALPFVWVDGEAVPSPGLTCLGLAEVGQRVPKRNTDGTLTTGELFDFTLHGA